MIVLDEAETLQRAIESVLPVVDEIVIGIDDRSSDASEEIARRFTDKVYRFRWQDDFSAARNEMLSRCTGDWVLVLDGHEVVRESCLPLFRRMLDALPKETEAVGFRLKMDSEDNNVSGLQLRLFRNNGGLRYEGHVHNVIECDPQKTIGFADIVIDHLRPLRNRQSREKQRNEMVPRRMEEVLTANPRDAKALYYLGIHAHERKDYRRAIEYYRRYLACSEHPEERYKVLWHLGLSLYQVGDKKAARETFFQGIEERWDLPECYIGLGDMALQRKNWDEAEHYFKLACDRKQPLSGVFFSEDFYTWLPYHKLCEVYDRAGRYYDAIAAGEKLLTFENLPEKHREEVRSFMPRWADKVISSQPVRCGEKGRRNLLIVDKGGHFSRALADNFGGRFNVEVINAFLPQYMKWADVAWFDWCDENIALASQARWGCRVICTLRSYEYFTEHPREVNWGNVDALLFVAQHVRRLSREKFPGLRNVKTAVIPDGVDLNRFTYRERRPGRDIAWVGFLNHKKNVPLLLEIASQLRSYRFHVAGIFQDERLRTYWGHYLRANGLDNIRFHGWVEDVDAFLEDKDYILSTSLWEGTQVAVLEAMAKGIKPLVHAWIGAEELYGPGAAIFRNTSELREALRDDNYRSAEYREWIEEHFSLTGRLARIEEMISGFKPDKTRIEGDLRVGGPISDARPSVESAPESFPWKEEEHGELQQ
jgi:glycosyltransferase involved in cell wall biosynthesis